MKTPKVLVNKKKVMDELNAVLKKVQIYSL